MVSTKRKSFDHYVKRMEQRVARRFPHLTFYLEMRDDREGTLYYAPYIDGETWEITDTAASVAMDALIEDDYKIHIQPAPPDRS